MADKKISALDALTTLASDDVLPVVDVSDLTGAATGTTKKMTGDVIRAYSAINYEHSTAGSMVYIPKFTHPDVAGVTFGGFMVGKYPASQPNATADDDNPDVADGAAVGVVPATSRPGVAPWRYINFLRARSACANLGVGWHLISAFEWASLALWSQLMGTQPHGNNANVNPPADVTYTDEIAILDRAGNARNAGWYPSLTGTGPVTWAHNHDASGVFGLNGNMWEWNDGLMLCPANLNDDSDTPHVITGAGGAGYALVLSNLEVSLTKSPYGASTAVAAGSLTDTNKVWTVNEFTGHFLYDVLGNLYYIDSNTATALTIDGASTPTTGAYTVLKLVSTDITAGMVSGNRILTLRNADADLKPFAIPATADGTGSATYGNDAYYFSTTSLRAALRGGYWGYGTQAGVFALYVLYSPSSVGSAFSLRVCRAL